ncbi:MAG: pyruvate kinase [Chlamydiota bacterium]
MKEEKSQWSHTKIICTIGPAVDSVEKMQELIEAGMNVARLNFSHGTHKEHAKTIEFLKKARVLSKKPISILLDTKGPEIRVGKFAQGLLTIRKGDLLTVVGTAEVKEGEIPIHPFEALANVEVGMRVLFDDGYVISEVVEKKKEGIVICMQNDGVIKSGKGMNIPDAKVCLPALTETDIEDLHFGCEHGVDLVAVSFVRSAEHVLVVKRILSDKGRSDIQVIAKIENKEGVENFDEIVEVADGIMVARGDLGVEVDLSLVPKLQKMMIRKSYQACKSVVTATQMLESMIVNPRPTRAEVSDVANAIYDSSSAVMLSAETAVGKYPVETVRQMKKIILQAEGDFDYRAFFYHQINKEFQDVSLSVSIASVQTAYSNNVRAIFVFTSSGFTARFMSSLRPEKPIIALTTNERTYYQMAFLWGVIPVLAPSCQDADEAFDIMSQFARKEKVVQFGDLIVMTAGVPFGKRGSTNMMRLESIGNILVRGRKGYGRGKVEGSTIFLLPNSRVTVEDVKGKIIVMTYCDKTHREFFVQAQAVVLQNYAGDTQSEALALEYAKEFSVPLILRAENALSLLKDQETIRLDLDKGLIFESSVGS